MDAVEANLSREEAKALIIFFYAEMQRHQRDVFDIRRKIKRVAEKHGIDDKELEELYWASQQFVDF